MLLIYDPRTNATRPTSYEELKDLLGRSRGAVNAAIKRKQKIGKLGGYLSFGMPALKDRRIWYAREEFKKEVWRNLEGSCRSYLISNHGRFKRVHKSKGAFVMPYQLKKSGSLNIKVDFLGEYSEYEVSRLVAHHFIGVRPPGMSVRRKNGILTDNHAGNLEYVTRKRLGQLTGAKSRSRAVIQLDAKTLKPINEFRSAAEAGRNLFLSDKTVLHNCQGKIKLSAGAWKFMFADEYEELIS